MDIGRSRVLLVEDNADDVMFVNLAFRRARIGHALMFVSDGEQAIDYLRGEGPYSNREKFPLPILMLLDLQMPKVDGFGVLRWVRGEARLRRLPITVFTGSNYPTHLAQAYELGANSFVLKPFKFEEFYRAISEIAGFWLGCCKLPRLLK
jgi:CheY-like chemotaxis protein